jgi:hypothetical protein
MRWRLLSHPVFTGSVALLAINDHVLKARWPGLITGKLSDIAGVIMFAIACTAITGRATLSTRLAAMAFTLLKPGRPWQRGRYRCRAASPAPTPPTSSRFSPPAPLATTRSLLARHHPAVAHRHDARPVHYNRDELRLSPADIRAVVG